MVSPKTPSPTPKPASVDKPASEVSAGTSVSPKTWRLPGTVLKLGSPTSKSTANTASPSRPLLSAIKKPGDASGSVKSVSFKSGTRRFKTFDLNAPNDPIPEDMSLKERKVDDETPEPITPPSPPIPPFPKLTPKTPTSATRFDAGSSVSTRQADNETKAAKTPLDTLMDYAIRLRRTSSPTRISSSHVLQEAFHFRPNAG
ncbi:hypothetical protein LshimejAT787_1501060 [Lyophyllum shimeji]|uniref:Uncharacterized protein n=1 Tax=Lyophyllum shimeji TaxID=47721 RepID=A0A9P3PZ68_LYOSH|nr:hypothetical protein LshimejAT787_1501060 [Lyophyllum shimeji]